MNGIWLVIAVIDLQTSCLLLQRPLIKYQLASLRQIEDIACPTAPSDTVQGEKNIHHTQIKKILTGNFICRHDGERMYVLVQMVHLILLVN
jgi:hypothetical protein